MQFQTKEFVKDDKNKCYTAEISDLQLRKPPADFILDGCLFELKSTDYSGGDVAGWHYSCKHSNYGALIIND